MSLCFKILASNKLKGFTIFIEEMSFHKQTSVGNFMLGIQFVDVLILILLFFTFKDSILVWYGHRDNFRFSCYQSASNKKTMFSEIPVWKEKQR